MTLFFKDDVMSPNKSISCGLYFYFFQNISPSLKKSLEICLENTLNLFSYFLKIL